MRRFALALLVLAGCRSLLGYEDPALVDANGDLPRIGFAVASEGADEHSGTIAVRITLSAPAADTVTVDCRVTGGTATAADFQGGTATVAIAPGQLATTVAVTILADADDAETDETIELALSQPVGAALGDLPAHTINISSVILPRVSFAAVASQTLESTPTLLAINLDMPAAGDATIVLGVSGGTPGSDYDIENNKAIAIPRGTVSVTVPIGEIDDLLDEDDEPITFQLLTPSPNILVGAIPTTTHTIADNDAPPGIGFANASSAAGEAGPSHTVTVALATESGKTVSVGVAAVAGGTASPADATFTQQMLVFAPGETMKSVVLDLVDDALDEDSETVQLGLVAPINATPTIANHTVTLADDDPSPVVSYAAAATTTAEGNTAVALTVNLSAPSGRAVTVPFTLDGATTAQAGSDFALPASPLVFDPGQTVRTITVAVQDDTLDEFDELVVVDLRNPTNALLGATAAHAVTITDDDGAAIVAFDATQPDRSVLEGDAGTAVFTYDVVLDRVSGKTITVPLIVTGTATTPGDFTIPTALPLVFQPGQTRKTITYNVVRDTANEADEDIVLTIDPNPTNAQRGAPNQHKHTIADDD